MWRRHARPAIRRCPAGRSPANQSPELGVSAGAASAHIAWSMPWSRTVAALFGDKRSSATVASDWPCSGSTKQPGCSDRFPTGSCQCAAVFYPATVNDSMGRVPAYASVSCRISPMATAISPSCNQNPRGQHSTHQRHSQTSNHGRNADSCHEFSIWLHGLQAAPSPQGWLTPHGSESQEPALLALRVSLRYDNEASLSGFHACTTATALESRPRRR